ncbi:GT2 family glycosyltransferase/glycosyltransferase involved in cell wall biosynthesis [Methylobacterium sp. BE186]|uniref:glycosyltransferase n=1 Tax=Methylobacterium sp. BE186 TaxID=2817715 RepID=UPI00285A056A|nr:glycosyltransferase [Methylobacterium sp. BE186]MDR7035672.1 GT2 family glycosyltransferase/glycosyltransferase involved in cell wall biosynthesis [Methylobacterium sp. BE186]
MLEYPLWQASTYRVIGSCIASWLARDDLDGLTEEPDATVAFWGCGLRDEQPLDADIAARCRFYGVRGPLSRDVLGLPPDTVLGDTALLLPLVHEASRDSHTAGQTVCVPHINDSARSEAEVAAMSGADTVLVPRITPGVASLRATIDAIASASFVLCGSLHAAIVAHAYDVPFAFWDSGHLDIPFKWRDFAGSIGIPTVFVGSVEEGRSAYEALIAPRRKRLPLTPILAVSPFRIRMTILRKALTYDGIAHDGIAESDVTREDIAGPGFAPEGTGRAWTDPGEERAGAGLEPLLDRERRLAARVEQLVTERDAVQAALTLLRANHEVLLGRADAMGRQSERDAAALGELRQLSLSLTESAEHRAHLHGEIGRLVGEVAGLRAERAVLEAVPLAHAERERSEREAADLRVALAAAERERAAAELAAEQERAAAAGLAAERCALTRALAEAEETVAQARAREAEQEEALLHLQQQRRDLGAKVQEVSLAHAAAAAAFGRRVRLLHQRGAALSELVAAGPRVEAGLERDALLGTGSVRTRRPAPPRRRLRDIRAALLAWPLFSPGWYGRTYADAAGLGDAAALDHFLAVGLAEERDPHPLFSSAWLRRRGQVPEGEAPLIAFLDGSAEGDPHPLFDTDYYRAVNGDVAAAGLPPLRHYLQHGAAERRRTHPAFDPAWYARQRGPAADDCPDLLVDYLGTPDAFGLQPHPLFDGQRYLAQVPGLAQAGINPLLHYLARGEAEGRSPHPLFHPAYYLRRNPDVAAAGLSPLSHFLRFGGAEHRQTHPLFDAWHYVRCNRDAAGAAENPLLHYVLEGAAEGRSPSDRLSERALAEALPDLDRGRRNPLVALLDGDGLRLDVPIMPAGQNRPPAEMSIPDRPAPRDRNAVYWLPDILREHVEARYGASAVECLHGLMRIIDLYAEDPNTFARSRDRDDLSARIAAAAAALPPLDAAIDVTIVVPVHNALLYTMTCVACVLEQAGRRNFEILIGDDASTDATPEVFAGLGGRVRLVRREENVGFLRTCNAVAAEARGHHLVFLNNDTLPLPGWLDALVALAERDPRAGIVGAKLLNGDGTLQEAGGILWRDASAWNFGRGSHPNGPAYNYVKEVDYCSGAALLLPRRVWDEMGGFDPLFAPAYCEDSDLAFRVRAAGYRALYQPVAEVIHHEGRSHGRDEGQGPKAYQLVNREKLLARWARTLETEHLPNATDIFLARDRSRGRPHLLVVDHYVPQWDRDAGSRTMIHFLRAFVDWGFHVVFWPDNLHQDPIYARPLQEMGIEVVYGPDYVGRFDQWISEHARWIGCVLLSRPHIAIHYVDAVKRHPGLQILYYGHDLHWRRLMLEHELGGSEEVLRLSEHFRTLEARLADLSDVVMYPQEEERALVAEQCGPGKAVIAVPAWVLGREEIEAARDAASTIPGRDPRRLLFVGGFTHAPNVDGILWFAREVLPLLRSRGRDIRLTIVGSNPPPEVSALTGADTEVTGPISDAELAAHYADAAVAIVPLRFGGGVKGKVIEAFAKGVPVVSTPVGLQGIPSREQLALCAETPEDFADCVARAADDRAGALERAEAAIGFVEREYTAAKLLRQLGPVMRGLSAP